MTHIRETGKRLGYPTGIHIVEPDPQRLELSIQEGYTFIAYSVDIRMLDVGARQGVSKLKTVLK